MSKSNGITYVQRKINGRIENIPIVGIGIIGSSGMARVHINGFKQMGYIFWPPFGIAHLVKVIDLSADLAEEAAGRYGFDGFSNRWQDLIVDDDIRIIINAGPNNIHAEPCIEAAKAGKDILCEKPLAKNVGEAKAMLDAVKKYKVKHVCGFNYRYIPALLLGKKIIDEGKIGKIQHIRAQYLQDFINSSNFPLVWRLDKEIAGSGAIGDLGAHIVDLARWLCGEPKSVTAITKTFIDERPLPDNPSKKAKVEVDDAFVSTVEFENGAIEVLESSGFCPGRKNYETIEINGELDSICWNLEHMNYLNIYFKEEDPVDNIGSHAVSVTESFHYYCDRWWAHGRIIGWENTFVHIEYNIVNAVENNSKLEPMVATFEDGYRVAVICDAILQSAKSGRKVSIKY